jgi:adenosylmethionine-8-amino-7-oxononanoate aminotransferase
MTTANRENALTSIEELALRHVWLQSTPWEDIVGGRLPKVFVKGAGIWLTDAQGREYLDAIAGIWVVAAGHGRREIADAMAEQAAKLSYVTAYGMVAEPTALLGEKLAAMSPGDLNRIFFVSSGSEAVETALKIAVQFQAMQGFTKRTKIISRRLSYHGSTYMAMSVGGEHANRDRLYGPMIPGAIQVPPPYPFKCEFHCYPQCTMACGDSLERTIEYEGPENVAAIIAEPISMPGGMAIPEPEYWPRLRRICDKYGILLIADEVITGFGRTGTTFGCEHWGVVPDIMAVAKALSSGYAPIGATLVRDSIFEAFTGDRSHMFLHVSTFGGHAVATAASLKNLEILEREDLVGNSKTTGAYLLNKFRGLEEHPTCMDVRGLGLWVGWEMVRDKATRKALTAQDRLVVSFTGHLADLGVLITRMGPTVQIAPPLTITPAECDELYARVDEAISRYEREIGLA